jgi:hypothetical protein
VIVVFNKSNQETVINLGSLSAKAKTNFNGTLQLENKESLLTLPPNSFEIITIQ